MREEWAAARPNEACDLAFTAFQVRLCPFHLSMPCASSGPCAGSQLPQGLRQAYVLDNGVRIGDVDSLRFVLQGPNPFEGVPANGMRCALRLVAAPGIVAAKPVVAQQPQGSEPSGHPVSSRPPQCLLPLCWKS
jgi:hypothetical protein